MKIVCGFINRPLSGGWLSTSYRLMRTEGQIAQRYLESHPGLPQSVPELNHLQGTPLCRFCEGAAEMKIRDVHVWAQITSQCLKESQSLSYDLILRILKCYRTLHLKDATFFTSMGQSLLNNCHRMTVQDFVCIFSAFEAAEIRPRLLYSEIFHSLARNVKTLNQQDFVDILTCFAELKIGNRLLLGNLTRQISLHIRIFSYFNAARIYAALQDLGVNNYVLTSLDTRTRLLRKMLRIQELLDEFAMFRADVHSWTPYETDLRDTIKQWFSCLNSESQIDELANPFETMAFLNMRGLLTRNYLNHLAMWCYDAVQCPKRRTIKRPTPA
eukprot:Filipodium_phascolosomae@DN3492_c0_g1_i1.p1